MVHYIHIPSQSIGAPGLKGLGELLTMGAQLILMFLCILNANGWAITTSILTNKNLLVVILVILKKHMQFWSVFWGVIFGSKLHTQFLFYLTQTSKKGIILAGSKLSHWDAHARLMANVKTSRLSLKYSKPISEITRLDIVYQPS